MGLHLLIHINRNQRLIHELKYQYGETKERLIHELKYQYGETDKGCIFHKDIGIKYLNSPSNP